MIFLLFWGIWGDFLSDFSKLRQLIPLSSVDANNINVLGKQYIDFSSNNYLGLADNSCLKEQSSHFFLNNRFGSTGSRLLSGDSQVFHDLESKLALLKGKECSLLFSSGYQCNVGVLPALIDKGDAIFFDRLCLQ